MGNSDPGTFGYGYGSIIEWFRKRFFLRTPDSEHCGPGDECYLTNADGPIHVHRIFAYPRSPHQFVPLILAAMLQTFQKNNTVRRCIYCR